MEQQVHPIPTSSSSPRTTRAKRAWLLVGIILALVCIMATLWVQWGQDVLIVRKWGVVDEGAVYRSGQISSLRIKGILQDNHIACVVSLSGEDEDADAKFERETCEKMGIPRKIFMMSGDGVASAQAYADAVAAIVRAKKEGKPVLVHCHSGSQRTGAVVALYRLLVLGDAPADAKREMLRFGHDPAHNPKLIGYLNRQMAEVAKHLIEQGVIARAPDPLPEIPQ